MDELVKVIALQTDAIDRLVSSFAAQLAVTNRVFDALDAYTASNAALLAALTADDEQEQTPATDLEGNPIRGLT